jgi:acetyltransferase
MLQVMSAETQRLPVSKSIDVGNKIGVDEVDFLNFIKDDAATKVVGLYIESVREPRLFLETARAVRKNKPIVLLKPGQTWKGAPTSPTVARGG